MFKNVNGLSQILACAAKVSNRLRSLDFDHKHVKLLYPKQMLERLPIALAKVKSGNKSEKLLNKIKQIIYFLHWEKEVTKKVYNNEMNY